MLSMQSEETWLVLQYQRGFLNQIFKSQRCNFFKSDIQENAIQTLSVIFSAIRYVLIGCKYLDLYFFRIGYVVNA